MIEGLNRPRLRRNDLHSCASFTQGFDRLGELGFFNAIGRDGRHADSIQLSHDFPPFPSIDIPYMGARIVPVGSLWTTEEGRAVQWGNHHDDCRVLRSNLPEFELIFETLDLGIAGPEPAHPYAPSRGTLLLGCRVVCQVRRWIPTSGVSVSSTEPFRPRRGPASWARRRPASSRSTPLR